MPSRQTLKDDKFRIIGHIDIDNNGKQTIIDPNFRKIGYFDPGANITSGAKFRNVGTGNLLTSLLSDRR